MRVKLSKDDSIYVTDEIINTQTHLIGTVLSILGTAVLIVKASISANIWQIVSFSIYGISLINLFLASTLFHGINKNKRAIYILKIFDYCSIYALIAGTFTPFCLIMLGNWLGWTVFGVIWFLVFTGIALKTIIPKLPKWFSNTLYITMGWIGIIIAIPLYKSFNWIGIGLLLLGGIFYSIGFVIYNIEKPNPVKGKFGFHEIWHIFVLLGAASHYLIMLNIVIPFVPK